MSMFVDAAAALYAGGLVSRTLFPGPPLWVHVAALALLAGVYTIFGGLGAVVISDSIQAVVLILGGALIFFMTLRESGPWRGRPLAARLRAVCGDGVHGPCPTGGRAVPWRDRLGWQPEDRRSPAGAHAAPRRDRRRGSRDGEVSGVVNNVLGFAILIGLVTLPLLLELGIRVLRRGIRRRRWLGMPEAEVDEPIRAVKRARLRIAPNGRDATLSGLTLGGRYEAEDDARCPRGCPHPADGCDCGFYALRPEAENHVFRTSERLRRATTVRLEVELSGAVLEYELGYRAEHQRVLRVTVPSICASCARFDATQRAVALVAVPPAQNPYGVSVLSRTRPGSPELWATLEPTCDLHRRARRAEPSVELPDLAGMIGTEVVWETAAVTEPPDR